MALDTRGESNGQLCCATVFKYDFFKSYMYVYLLKERIRYGFFIVNSYRLHSLFQALGSWERKKGRAREKIRED